MADISTTDQDKSRQNLIQRITSSLLSRARSSPEPGCEAEWVNVPGRMQNAIVNAIAERKYPVLLLGQAGRGKTYAMACVYRGWPAKRPNGDRTEIQWNVTSTILSRIMRCRMDGYIVEGGMDVFECQILDRVARCDLACFDDIGVRSLSPAQYEALLELVNSRVGKPTFYTTNLEPKELSAVLDARIASRLCAGTIIRVSGADRRVSGNKIIEC